MFVCGQGAPKRILPIYFFKSLTPTPLQEERGVKCKAKENCIGDDRWKNCIIFNFQSNCELIIVNCELLIDNCKLQNALLF